MASRLLDSFNALNVPGPIRSGKIGRPRVFCPTFGKAREAVALMKEAMAFGRTLTVFVPKLRAAGVKKETLHTIVHDNPLRFLAFQPRMG